MNDLTEAKGVGMLLTVNNERITEQQIADEIARLKPKHDEIFRDLDETERGRQLREWATENIVDNVLLRQAASLQFPPVKNEELHKVYGDAIRTNGGEKEFTARMSSLGLDREQVLRDLDLQLRTEKYIRFLHQDVPKPSENEVREFYENHLLEYQIPQLVRAGHIVVYVNESRSLEEAESIISEIEKKLYQGASFEELANAQSDCSDNDGDLGWFPRGEMVEEFENAVFALKPGETSGIIRTPFGFHIARVYDVRPARVQPLDNVRHLVVERLMSEKQQAADEAALDALRATAIISRADHPSQGQG